MRLELTGRHVDITPALRQLIERRLAQIERTLNNGIITAKVVLTLEKYRHRVEMVIFAKGDHTLRGHGEGNAWPLSIRQATEKVAQQAATIKTKWKEGKRSRARRRTPRAGGPLDVPTAADGGAPRVVRATRYAVKPMSVEDAAMRVEDGPETFLVFRNAETDAVSILYRRKDGNLGLIEPD